MEKSINYIYNTLYLYIIDIECTNKYNFTYGGDVVKRILVIGSPGSGKSTLSRKISQKLGILCVHLDRIFWQPNWVQTPKEQFDLMLQQELEKESWIIDGNYKRTLQHRLQYADTVIWLDLPTLTCMLRVLCRHGKKRPDMTEECVEKFDKDFVQFLGYIWNFKREQSVKMAQMLNNCSANVIIIKNKKQLEAFEREMGII